MPGTRRGSCHLYGQGEGYETETNVPYRNEADASEYARERCRLDLYYPSEAEGFPTVVWFHGGGLTSGEKFLPPGLMDAGVAVVAVNYRLSPRAEAVSAIDDAAAAVAWTLENIGRYGGSRDLVFVAGHSAGGYLASMVGLDRRWLRAYGVDADDIAGLIPYSGHAITHLTIRAERGIGETQPVVDDLSPLFHVREDAPPLLLITGDREKELLGRYEENAYLWRMMRVAGHEETELYELEGFDHGGMAVPAHPLLLKFVDETSEAVANRDRQD